MYCMICFGINTYTDHEWGYGDEDPSMVNPVGFDARQPVAVAKAGGFRGIVIVAKHHDGFCLWPTKTTPRNISRSPWKNGKGDMIREYQRACAALGMKLGLYCSPWDRNNAAYGTEAYIDIYRAQLKELYTNYGPLFISWFDGANGGDGYYGGARERRTIDRTTYYGWDTTWKITRQMQPGAVIFGDVGPDVRWVGNEQGHAAETSWAAYTPQAPDPGRKPASGYSKYELAPEGTRNGECWMPAECDVPIRPGWFYHASQDGQVKTPAELLDLYYASVGRGADLDLGLAPNKQGLLDIHDVRSLKTFGGLLRQTFAVNLAAGARLKASNVRGNDKAHYGSAFLLDQDRYSYWATDDSVTTPSVEFDLGTPKTFNVIRLRENIKLGQRIDSVAVDIYEGGSGAPTGSGRASAGWRQIASATSIGPNRLIRLGHNITAARVRLRITGSPVCIALSDFGLYRERLQSSAAVNRILFPGISHSGWGVPPAFPDSAASNGAFPRDITICMGKEQWIKAFTYLPGQDRKTSGIVDRYAFYTSENGLDWDQVKEGEFSNIAANPLQQLVPLKNPVRALYFRFSALHMIGDGTISMAELGVITR
jgi:alpha-L-fucosidase